MGASPAKRVQFAPAIRVQEKKRKKRKFIVHTREPFRIAPLPLPVINEEQVWHYGAQVTFSSFGRPAEASRVRMCPYGTGVAISESPWSSHAPRGGKPSVDSTVRRKCSVAYRL